jgi:polar amino acid transport system substrate-binding protein
MVAQDPDTTIVGPKFTHEPYGLAMSRNDPQFTRFVNAVLAEMRADGTWLKIYHKWLPGTAQPPIAQYQD